MRGRQPAPASVVNLDEIAKIELIVARRLQERTAGEHRSRAEGAGFDFVGLRDWHSGDRTSAIDWPQSTITNFSPIVVREFDQPSTVTVMAVADLSLSTRCGVARGPRPAAPTTPIAMAVARALAVIGLSAAFFQDRFGLIAFERDFSHLAGVAPRAGRNHVVHCLDAYLARRGLEPVMHGASVSTTLAGSFRTTSLVPFISDFLFDEAIEVVRELALLNATHDVFVVLIDSAFAFQMPEVSARWIEVEDVETGTTRTLSRQTFATMGERVGEWQARVEQAARDADLDVVRVGLDAQKDDLALSEFVAERRLRKPAR
jgi:uncharacterized protein (DUF58 family)